ncbi:MAG: lipoprotein [Pseudomonadota bacterium]
MTRWAVLLAAGLALALSGCGKKGDLEPPEDDERDYTYPAFYPPPDTVNPGAPEVRDTKEDPAGLELTAPAPSLTPLPPGRTSTETYGSPEP